MLLKIKTKGISNMIIGIILKNGWQIPPVSLSNKGFRENLLQKVSSVIVSN